MTKLPQGETAPLGRWGRRGSGLPFCLSPSRSCIERSCPLFPVRKPIQANHGARGVRKQERTGLGPAGKLVVSKLSPGSFQQRELRLPSPKASLRVIPEIIPNPHRGPEFPGNTSHYLKVPINVQNSPWMSRIHGLKVPRATTRMEFPRLHTRAGTWQLLLSLCEPGLSQLKARSSRAKCPRSLTEPWTLT